MVLLNNPLIADLQQRIQNSSFGSPNYLQDFTGIMPEYQKNLLANNFQPGLISRDLSGATTSMNPSGVPNYLGYTPDVPPEDVNNNTMLPINTMVNTGVRQDGGIGRDGLRFGKPIPDPIYNPNLLGAYIGYNNPNYAASPYGQDANILGDFIEAIQRKKVSTVAKIKEIAGGGYSPAEGTTGTGGTVSGGSQPPQGPYKAAEAREIATDKANTAANQRNLDRKGGGGAGRSRPEASGSGRVGSTGPTARSKGGW